MPTQADSYYEQMIKSISDTREQLPTSPQTGSPNAVTAPQEDTTISEAVRPPPPQQLPEDALSRLRHQRGSSALTTSPNTRCGPQQSLLSSKQRRAAQRRDAERRAAERQARLQIPTGGTSPTAGTARAYPNAALRPREQISDPAEIYWRLSAIAVYSPPTPIGLPERRGHTASDPLICDLRARLRSRDVGCALCAFYEWGPIVETHKLKRCSHRAESSEAQSWLTMFRTYRASGGGTGARCHVCRFPLTLCWRTAYREQMNPTSRLKARSAPAASRGTGR
ncbi:hypothetical protein CCHR01_19785 [Colletotrichum chrysophilum]|uniref:Uncharacterized protein n=1 Tax=Colletotrichum chrysophilum TaxID=1836956 RepID=A0AAD8ZYD5_9PEZI|nr:hypothetical protein CCHR01_19785 [Colletotrichum chrysophilum]